MAAMEKNNKNLNVPNLRFPEFSGEWERFRNCTLFKVISEKNKNYEFFTVLSASQTEGMVLRDSLGIDIKFEEDSIKTYKIVRNGDYVAHLRSFQGGFAFSDKTGVCSPAYTILRPSETISYGFLKPYFMSRKFIDSLRIVTYGIRDGKSISVEEWLKLYTCIPKKNEQQKIAKFLRLIDNRIETQKKIIEKYESLIKGIRYNLLNFNSSARICKLKDICKITTGKSDANAMEEGGVYPFFTCAEEPFAINTYAFDTEALLVSGNGANVGYINYCNGKFNAYQRTYVLYDFSVNIHYVRYYMDVFLRQRIDQEKNVGNTPYIVLSTLADMKIRIPSHARQLDICRVIKVLENKLTIEIDLCNSYQQVKDFLLRRMFI